ncbi:hypothetical protein BVRB_7g174800 isoform A [Beta vulgaris subsp. vulgaris]|nr:hypothetical protein BVRB_7g174800 isoform A [Beta vulgaris subsp. vulgaris]
MQLFDLNIPYLESEKSISDKSSKKQTRLKLIVKSMELGYTGIAYNRTIKGIMSESDRCTISPFPLSSLLNVSPSLSSTVSFHRRLLGVSENSAFRQYTRLTMVVETSTQASALNSGNPVLKTYDLIAVKPLNQNSFDLACQSMQVDLISIDFAEKLPFRLKLPMVKAAIARGVYFEIMYSSLMQDAQVRRQMISNAKLLVEWTQGKNLIVSSAAPSVLELRGPNDVANLLSLLGLSNECAKATISKNCSVLIGNAVRKKQFYKEAIRVEVMPPGVQTDPKEPWIVDHVDWDPLTSGEGDLLLDDMAKAFAESGKVSQTDKGVRFSSFVDSVQSHGLQGNDVGFRIEGKVSASDKSTDLLSTSKNLEVSKKSEKPQNSSSLLNQQYYAVDEPQNAVLDSPMDSLELKNLNAVQTTTSPIISRDPELQNDVSILENHVLLTDNVKEVTLKDVCLDVGCIAGSRMEVITKSENLDRNDAQTDDLKLASGVLNPTNAGISTDKQLSDESGLSLSPDVSLGGNLLELKEDPLADRNAIQHDGNVMDVDSFIEKNGSEEMCKKKEQKKDHSEVKIDSKKTIAADTMMLVDPLKQEKQSNDLSAATSTLSDDKITERRIQVTEIGEAGHLSLGENELGNLKVKWQHKSQILRFPFKRLLQVPFKKKGRSSMYKTKKRE